MISLIHPSRQRPLNALLTAKKWFSRTTEPVEYILSLDSSDDVTIYRETFNGMNLRIIVNNNHSAVDAINAGAKESKGNILIVVSDDTDCPERWNELINQAVEGKSDYLLRVSDGIQKYICTMPVMDRAYYNRYGYMYHPRFKHMFVDTLITHVADVTKRIIWRDDISFPHLHYSINKGQKDEVSVKADQTVHEGKILYLEMVRNKFADLGIKETFDIWDFDQRAYSSGHVQWLKNYLR